MAGKNNADQTRNAALILRHVLKKGIGRVIGAIAVEKHFTLNKALHGNDHYHAMSPEDAKNILNGISFIEEIRGKKEIKCLDTELPARQNARRSLVAAYRPVYLMNILVIGGAGYIGSHTSVALLEAGHHVVAADNLCNSKAETLDKIKRITNKKIIFYQIDITQVAKGKLPLLHVYGKDYKTPANLALSLINLYTKNLLISSVLGAYDIICCFLKSNRS